MFTLGTDLSLSPAKWVKNPPKFLTESTQKCGKYFWIYVYTVREVAPVAPPVVVVPEIVTSTPAVSTNWFNSLFALFSKKCGNKLNINLSINLFTYLFTCLLFVFYLSIFLLNPQVIKTNYLNNSQNKIRIRFPMSVFIFPLLFSDHFPCPNNKFPTLSHSFLCNSVTLIPAPSPPTQLCLTTQMDCQLQHPN